MKILGIKIIFESKKVFCSKKILGLKNNFGSKKVFESKKYWVLKNCVKILGSKKFWVLKNLKKIFGQKKIWVRKNFGSEKKFWLKKNLVLKIGRKIFRSQKESGCKKISCPKNFGSKNILSQQFLAPTLHYGIGLSKVGWIGRGRVGMGVPFLGFNVAYIPNLSLLQSLEPFENGSPPTLGNRVKFGCYTLDDVIFVS